MANVIINDTNLTNIANAIREKNGGTTKYKPSEMASAILAIEGGGSATLPDFNLTGNCSYLFESGKLNWVVEDYANKISTNNITNAWGMFANSELVDIPITLHFYVSSGAGVELKEMFMNCVKLKSLPTLDFDYTITDFNGDYLFYNCRLLREIPSNFIKTNNSKFAGWYLSRAFTNCHSLRSISNLLTHKRTDTWETGESSYIEMFKNCYVLDEIKNLPVKSGDTPMFTDTFTNCFRLKELTFERRDNTTPYEVEWGSVGGYSTIDLTGIGYVNNSNIPISTLTTSFNSGITADKEVYDATTYQALKNDADWFTYDINYSRYNKTSAVNTIKSLPKATKATIKFKGTAGSLTDGGAINTMTEEQIAVAVSKGWTVSFT